MSIFSSWRIPRSPFFRAYPAPAKGMELNIDLRTAVDRQRGFIYFRIPKAANSTVMINLLQEELEGPSKNAKRAYARVSSLSKDEVSHLTDRFFLFAVVRNPYTRVASAYLDKIVRGKRSAKVHARLATQANEDIPFADFCRYLQSGGVYEDPHWYPQIDLIPCGYDKLHFIGRVENLGTDLAHILRKIGSEPARDNRSWNPHQTGANSQLERLYSQECIEIVSSLYQEDFAAFGYSIKPEW